jgi:hypothetical protein
MSGKFGNKTMGKEVITTKRIDFFEEAVASNAEIQFDLSRAKRRTY